MKLVITDKALEDKYNMHLEYNSHSRCNEAIMLLKIYSEKGRQPAGVAPIAPRQGNYLVDHYGPFSFLLMVVDGFVFVLRMGTAADVEAFAYRTICEIHPTTGALQMYEAPLYETVTA